MNNGVNVFLIIADWEIHMNQAQANMGLTRGAYYGGKNTNVIYECSFATTSILRFTDESVSWGQKFCKLLPSKCRDTRMCTMSGLAARVLGERVLVLGRNELCLDSEKPGFDNLPARAAAAAAVAAR